MIKKVSVTTVMFQADDGSFHDTEEAAIWRNNQNVKEDQRSKVMRALDGKIDAHFTSLSNSIFPFDRDKWYDTQHERVRFREQLCDLIVENWDELKAEMEEEC